MPSLPCNLCGTIDPDSFRFNRKFYNRSAAFDPEDVANANAAIDNLRSKLADIQEAIAKLQSTQSAI